MSSRQPEMYKLTFDEVRDISNRCEGEPYEKCIADASMRKIFKYLDMVKGYYQLPSDDPYIKKNYLVTFPRGWWEEFGEEIRHEGDKV